MEKETPINSVLEQTLTNLKSIIDIDCIVGKPIIGKNGSTIIPVSKVSIGFVSGGGEYQKNKPKPKKSQYPFAGGSGAGCNVSPMGFLVINENNVKYINIDDKTSLGKIFDFADKLVNKIKKD